MFRTQTHTAMMKSLLASAVALAFVAGASAQTPMPGDPAPDFTLTSAEGNQHSLSDFRGQVVVLEWVNHGCPFVRKHYSTGNMQQLQQRYTDDDVVWLSICSSAEGKQGYMEPAAILEARSALQTAETAYLIDASGDVGRTYGAERTPEMVVIGEDGSILYRGAIHDNSSANPATVEGASNFVAAALDAVMAGEMIPTSMEQPYGCTVKY